MDAQIFVLCLISALFAIFDSIAVSVRFSRYFTYHSTNKPSKLRVPTNGELTTKIYFLTFDIYKC